jgi:hypothetical protein
VSVAVRIGLALPTDPTIGGVSMVGSRKTIDPSPYSVKCGTIVAAKLAIMNPPPSS